MVNVLEGAVRKISRLPSRGGDGGPGDGRAETSGLWCGGCGRCRVCEVTVTAAMSNAHLWLHSNFHYIIFRMHTVSKNPPIIVLS